MNATEIDITDLVNSDGFDPWELSNSMANLGEHAGEITWANARRLAASPPDLLPTEEHVEAWKDFVDDSGGWTREEIDAWTPEELRALLLQWIAGDIRNGFGDDLSPEEWDWAEYEEQCEAGQCASTLFRTDDGRIFFSIAQ